mgnify:CR=1 FL=1|tara:strand:+ start:393 stop:1838 length:1446 start_codon:yes stop_codon:yes gene_type:complete
MAMFRNVNLAPIDTSGFERAGAAYGQMFQNLGNTIAETIQKVEKKKQQKVASEAIQQDYGVSKEVADAMARQDNILAFHQFTKQQQLAQDQLDEAKRMGQARRDLIDMQVDQGRQAIDQAERTFDLSLEQLETGIAKDEATIASILSQTDRAEKKLPRELDKLDAEIAATEAGTKATIAGTELKNRYFELAQSREDREAKYQKFNQDVTQQRLDIEQQLADNTLTDSKSRRELEAKRLDLQANAFAFDQMFRSREQFEDKRQFDLTHSRLANQFKKEMRIKRKQLDQSERQLVAAIKSGKVGNDLKRAQTKHYEALAAAGPSVSSSEFERIVNKAGFSPEQVDELYKDRALQLAGADKAPTAQEVAKLVGGYKPNGIHTIETISGLLSEANAGGELNDEPIRIKEENGQKFIVVTDSEARESKITITPDVEKQVDIFRENTMRAIAPDPGQPSVSAPTMTDEEYGAAIDAEFRKNGNKSNR